MAWKKLSVREYGFYDFMKWVCFWPVALYLRPKRIYLFPEKGKRFRGNGVVLYNHTSFMDVLYLQLGIWNRRHRIVSEREQLGHGKNRIFLKLLLSIPIDRDSVSPASVRAIVRPLREGHLVDIFPEGILNREPYTLLPFKNGPAFLAHMGGAPLIPVFIDRGSHFWNRLRFYFGEPFLPEDWEKTAAEHGTESAKETIPFVTACLEERMKALADYAREKRKQ